MIYILIAIVLGILSIYCNKDMIKLFWHEHITGDYSPNDPPFCFECNEDYCATCQAYDLWLDGKIDEAEKEFSYTKYKKERIP